jgi:hypothetical protein
MAKHLLLKHYRGAPAPVNAVPMDQWSPDEVEAHIRFMNDFARRTMFVCRGQSPSHDGTGGESSFFNQMVDNGQTPA